MSKQREPSLGLLLGLAFVVFLNSVVILFSATIFGLSFSSLVQAPGRIEAIFVIITSILNLIAVKVERKSKFLTIVRRTAVAGNAVYLLLAVQAIVSDTFIVTLLCFGAAAVNIAGIMFAPTDRYQQDMICPECDYDLRGLKSRGCPECGWGRNTN